MRIVVVFMRKEETSTDRKKQCSPSHGIRKNGTATMKREAENETAASGADDHHAPEATLPYGDIVNNVNMK